MSSNSQWKTFQPSLLPSTHLQEIIELQNTSIQTKHTFRNGSFSGDYPSSPRDSFGNIGGTASGNRFGNNITDSSTATDLMGSYNATTNTTNSTQQYEPPIHPNRETGIIEKLLHSYGFIQCCERQARLFFHFSQFSGNIEHLKIGDPVEFEMTYDRRTGKPIASTVTKIAPEVVLSEARVTGTVTTELRGEGVGDTTGRISYENRGECFFLPYTKDDVEGNVTLRSGDAVSFQIATNQRGNLGACHVRLENPAHPVKYHGVVCSMKESFGFIERADVVKEIFFHFSEAKTKEELNLGDDVEFIIQTRNGKEVACNITRLPGGSVVFEDVCAEITKGQVLKPLERGNNARHQNDPLPGRIRYRAPDHSEVDVPFGDKDQMGEFTLRHGDWVQFQVATDRRDQLRRATNISLLDASFAMSGERREKGIVSTLKDGFGFIRCEDREPHLFFHFTEVLLLGQVLNIGDEVEFTLDPVTSFSNLRPSAIRIKHLPPGSVQFETLVQQAVSGVISKELTHRVSSPTKPQQEQQTGLISYQQNGLKKTITFYGKDVVGKIHLRTGDKVTFDIYQIKRSKELIGMGVALQQTVSNGNGTNNSSRTMLQGFIAALKDGFGFIETKDHDKEVFFHFSNFEGSVDILELGRDVEYIVGRQGNSSGGCCSAELVRVLPKGSIPVARATDNQLQGTVTRALRSLNPDQQQYSGVIEASGGVSYEYGIMGLASKRDLVRIGDSVTFQVDTLSRATNIVPIRKKRRSTVDSIKGAFGFLTFELEDGKKLIFYMSEVRGPSNTLQPGDTVEFSLITNQRNGKSLACHVTKVSPTDGETDTLDMSRDSDYFVETHAGSSGNTESARNSNKNLMNGTITRTLRSFNADQPQFTGLIEASYGGGSYEYNSMGLACKRDLLRIGDPVTFQVDAQNRATGITPSRKKKRGTIDSIKGSFGFISTEAEDSKKIIFYMSDVRGSPNAIQPGDSVEYIIVTNPRNGKSTACNVTKAAGDPGATARPERLIIRLRTASLDEHSGPRMMVIRKPKGPDGTRGFRPRVAFNPASVSLQKHYCKVYHTRIFRKTRVPLPQYTLESISEEGNLVESMDTLMNVDSENPSFPETMLSAELSYIFKHQPVVASVYISVFQ